eukprot:TRINITY_DN18258_c0_g1_i1.p1 TRINITY_DN18258_c0_g1~~TRINITY_DN18258_c0_g1_i1.p1  ORF type:complete len:453 (-),score=113.93 TRINITY_DN18258_c0_g1_i1:323-1681(-)
MRTAGVVVSLTACALAGFLQGCGESGSSTPAPTPSPSPPGPPTPGPGPTPPPTPPSPPTPKGWKLNPIEVKGQHLFDSVTGEEFFGKGIGFPNLRDNIDEWTNVLKTIRAHSKDINLVRVYELPACATNSTLRCLDSFMKAADDLGFYVLIPGTGTVWGYLPRKCKHGESGSASCCTTAEECYKNGGVLGWGQTMLQQFNFPNTLAIVVGNEFDQQTPEFMPTIKAYTRDLKKYMNMCDSDTNSPSKGQMRQIPLMYASSDDRGDTAVNAKADYCFCGDSAASVDIFGLNIERFCDPVHGPKSYDGVQKWVSDGQYPGAFMFSEMGCTKTFYKSGARGWEQVEGFFENWKNFEAFIAYAYFGNKDFDMFDAPTSTAKILPDGENFFKAMQKLGKMDGRQSVTPKSHDCATTMLGRPIDPIDKVPYYDTGATGWAPQCPKPTPDKPDTESIIL